ncbi:MAG: ATP-binding protein [Bacteroidota bacterium]
MQLCTSISLAQEIQTFSFDSISAKVSLNPYLYIKQSPLEEIDISALQDDSTSWISLKNLGFILNEEDSYWAKMRLKNNFQNAQSLVLFPDRGYVLSGNSFVDLLIERKGEIVKSYKSGRFLAKNEKSFTKTAANHFLVEFEAGEELLLYIRVNQINKVAPFFDIYLQSEESVQYSEVSFRIGQGVFQGMLWIMIFFSALIFVGSRDRSYLIYVLFLFSSSIYFLYRSGLFFEIFFHQFPQLQLLVWILSINALVVTYFQFVRIFVDTRSLIPKWDRVCLGWQQIILLVMAVELVILFFAYHEPYIDFLINVSVGASIFFLLVVSIRFFRTKERLAQIMIFGTLFLVLAGIVGLAADLLFNIKDYLRVVEFFFIAEVLTFSLGLGYRQDLNRKLQLEVQEKANEQLRHMDKLKDQFLANTSHELKTPLNGIIGITESLIDGMKDFKEDFIRENLQMVVSSSHRLNSLVGDLLDFSRIKNKQLDVRKKALDLYSITDVVLKIHQPLLKGKELMLENRIPKHLPAVDGDEGRIQQIFHNLIGNAIKFTEKGTVSVHAVEKNEMLEVRVEDTGIGIPEDKRELIFNEFEQADGSIARKFAGTGLGLSISKKLVELHGGEMWVRSSMGKGSTFFFTLPISTQKAAPLEMIPKSQELSSLRSATEVQWKEPEQLISSKGDSVFRILIVDDEPINHQVLRNHLIHKNYHLDSAMNGAEALQLIDSEQNYDLVLLDVMMPRMSGYEVCQKIREKYLVSELPVIFITAKNQVNDLVQGLSLGGNDYLSKPFTRNEFLARITTQLNLHNINAATGKFVPRSFLQTLGYESILELRLGVNVEREVTVFFSDIRSYTSLAESMSPDQNFRFVNAYSSRMGPIINQYKGFVHQYLGDGIMAIFLGSGKDALKASVEMQITLSNYNMEREKKGKIPVRVGMGLHTGKLIMGIIGDKERMEPATISDTVNTAARVEGLTKHFGVNILLSEFTRLQLGDDHGYKIRFLGKVMPKGKNKAIGLYECFDGDSIEIRQKKESTQELFEKALTAYFAKDFDTALRSFAEIIRFNPDDKPASMYLLKATEYRGKGVSEDWTGVEMMHKK